MILGSYRGLYLYLIILGSYNPKILRILVQTSGFKHKKAPFAFSKEGQVEASYLGGPGAPAGRGGAPRFGNEPQPAPMAANIAPSNIILINFFFIAAMFL